MAEITAKTNCSTANNRANPFRLLFAKIAGYEDCDSHSKLCHHKGNKVQYLASGRNGGQSGSGTKSYPLPKDLLLHKQPVRSMPQAPAS